MYGKEMGVTDNLLMRMVRRWFHAQDLLLPGSPRAFYGDEDGAEVVSWAGSVVSSKSEHPTATKLHSNWRW